MGCLQMGGFCTGRVGNTHEASPSSFRGQIAVVIAPVASPARAATPALPAKPAPEAPPAPAAPPGPEAPPARAASPVTPGEAQSHKGVPAPWLQEL